MTAKRSYPYIRPPLRQVSSLWGYSCCSDCTVESAMVNPPVRYNDLVKIDSVHLYRSVGAGYKLKQELFDNFCVMISDSDRDFLMCSQLGASSKLSVVCIDLFFLKHVCDNCLNISSLIEPYILQCSRKCSEVSCSKPQSHRRIRCA